MTEAVRGAAGAWAPEALQALLDAPYGAVRHRVRALLATPEFRYRDGLDRAAYREQVWAWCGELARRGLGALGFPPAYGGAGDLGQFIAAFETLAFHDASLLVKFGVQFGLFGGSILQLGSERHHRAYLAEVADLRLPGAFAMSETGHGSNVADLKTLARFDPATAEFVIETSRPLDRKDWIGNAACHGRMATVFAQLEVGGAAHGVHAFLVPIRQPDGAAARGVTVEDCGEKAGLNGVDNGRLSFDRVRVPRENLLNRFADVSADGAYSSPIANPARRFFTMLGTLIGGRISVAAAALSAAKSGLAIALRYGVRRRQFGPAGQPEMLLLDYPSHQRRLLPRLAACYALDFAHKSLVQRFLGRAALPEPESRAVEALAAGLKAYGSRHAVDTLQVCRECCGGQGYLAVNRLPRLRDDADVYTTFEGDNTVLLQLVAKACLTSYRDHFEHMGFLPLLKHLVGEGAVALGEHMPSLLHAGAGDEDHLLASAFQLGALRSREQHLLASASRRLRARLDRGADPFAAFNDCHDHLQHLALAHLERVVGEAFARQVEETEEGALRGVLRLLRNLFVLWRLEEDAAWFLESGHLEVTRAKAIRRLVNRLCGEVRPHALALVAAWGIPDACLAAPIAFGPEAQEAGK